MLVDSSLCTGCGLCIEVCKGFNLFLEKGKVICQDSVYGCM
ncbi:4Fe-4S binding protein [Desulfosporosinus sp.]